MSIPARILPALLAGALLSPVFAIGAQNPSAQAPAPQATALEDVEQAEGPFSLVGQTFTVVLRSKRLRTASNPALRQTLDTLQIRDTSGAVLYQKTFPHEVQGGSFQQSVTASARLLSGGDFAALLIRYVTAPSAPGSAESWQLFHFLAGKLVPFEKPTSMTPGPGPFRGAVAMGPGGARPAGFGAPGDLVELRVWTGNFYVLVPLQANWPQSRLTPGEQCFEMFGGAMRETGCNLRVEANRKPAAAVGFLRLFREAVENEYNARHVVLNKNSKIEFLSARAIAAWSADGDAMKVNLSDVWLKLMVDNNDDNLGWIHGDEDFAAVGLPPGSPAP